MKIVKFTAEHVKRLSAVEITPTGELVEIAGNNGAGKTSILDSIWWALGGERVVQDDPIRHGEAEAFVELDLGEMVVTRRWKHGKNGVRSTLKVRGANGEKYDSPQKMLDELMGALTFDPLEFSRMKPREQRDLLMDLCGIGEVLNKIDEDRKKVFGERTLANRDVASVRNTVLAYDDEIRNLSAEEIAAMDETSVADALSDLELAQAKHETYGEAVRLRDSYIDEAVKQSKLIDSLTEQASAAYEARNVARECLKKMADAVDKFELPDLDELRESLGTVEEDNAFVREAKAHAGSLDELAVAEDVSARLTGKIDVLDELKAKHLSKAKFPIRGLSFSEDGVIFGGNLFEQCSGAEQLKVSTAIGMALNPKLRVLRITDGSLLDLDNLKFLEDMAKLKDFQIWIERVEPGTDAAILIEDGHVAEAVGVGS